MNKFGLSNDHLSSIKIVLQKYPQIEKTQIIGSRAMGNYQNYSDIDLVLYGNINQDLHGKIKQELEDLPISYTFDVLIFNEINSPTLLDHIQKEGKDF